MLMKNDSSIIRILKTQEGHSLVIDCIKRTMPKWVATISLSSYSDCSDTELESAVGFALYRELMPTEQRIAQERYNLISPILPFIGDESKRTQMINLLSEHKSKQTIRKYLCLYLAFQTISALAPIQKEAQPLTQDEKNMRWGLNKFFYTQHKNSLHTAYMMTLQARYCDSYGQLYKTYPTFNQFRYFYRKTRKMQNYYIARDGLKNYQRNNRPLLGDGVQQFAPAVGVGMLDSTICDIYLVDDGGKLIGRPVLTACIDAFSSLCMGYSLGWEGGTYSLRGLMLNVIAEKQSWCQEHGVFIEASDWDTNKLPGVFVTDKGTEYKGDNFSQITELGVRIINLPAYRPELKGSVEKFFDLLQGLYKKHLKGKGVVEPDAAERGAHDYRLDACLTLREFEQIILHCIIYYNSKRVVDFPFTEEMIAAMVKPHASNIFAWGQQQMGANLIETTPHKLVQTLLPRCTAKFKRNGLNVNGMRYKNDDPKYIERYLTGGEVTVAYNPDNVSECWVIEKGSYVPFTLIERRFAHKSLDSAKAMQKSRKQTVSAAIEDNLQAQIDLAEHIQIISANKRPADVGLKNIRSNRKAERAKTHIDYTKEVR